MEDTRLIRSVCRAAIDDGIECHYLGGDIDSVYAQALASMQRLDDDTIDTYIGGVLAEIDQYIEING